ncbi:TPA: AAA family ATPase, partial [Streptococcus suis]
SILDALAISVGSYLAKISTASSISINKEDSLRLTYETGSVLDTQSQFPVAIYSEGVFYDQEFKWKRELNGWNNRTTIKDASEIMDIGMYNQYAVMIGDTDVILPIVSYYGTGRLYKKKSNRKNTKRKRASRLDGYIDALSSGTNEKELFKWFEDMSLIQIQDDKKVPELEAVKRAIVSCFEISNPNISDISVSYSFKSKEIELTYKKSNTYERLPLHLFSDGIRITLTMVADIASRMAKLNPQLLDKVLETPGVVLIDEIDMHLHPTWQRKILESLLNIFPNIQIVTTTHSPVVVSNVKSEYLRLLKDNDIYDSESGFGKDINDILREIMETDYRPKEITDQISLLNTHIQNGELSKAEELLLSLKDILGEDDSGVVAAKASLELERFFEEIL